MKNLKEKIGFAAISGVILTSAVTLFLHDPIPQDAQYHFFADSRIIYNIPNFWNVISSLSFLIVGSAGIRRVFNSTNFKSAAELRAVYFIFFLSISLVGFGSSYYHLRPCNETLLWDRLPMSISFMAFMSIIIGEFISFRSGQLSLPFLLIIGIFSVVYWHVTETKGVGDLRFYILVQFLPILIIPIILVCFESEYTSNTGYWLLLGLYIIAKCFEYLDSEMYKFRYLLSGHTFKHLTVTFGVCFLLRHLSKRQIRQHRCH